MITVLMILTIHYANGMGITSQYVTAYACEKVKTHFATTKSFPEKRIQVSCVVIGE